ncbi:carboxypeptidase A4-like [Ptychodera flava]|uniref:carboxypeptidase A4-like n=1 Tax=Ptychodera flava TaxID=63121 RepID=UPI00396A9E1F
MEERTRKQPPNFVTLFILLYLQCSQCGDVKPKTEIYLPDYSYYHNMQRLGQHLEEIVSRNPYYLKLEKDYISRQGRPQYIIRMTNFSDSHKFTGSYSLSQHKPKILLSCGEHAREFFPIESVIYLLQNITSGLTASKGSHQENFSRNVLSKLDLFIIAMVNPDGRHYIEETGNYCWRGTSTGVDLNRNFDWLFGGRGSSGNSKDEEYRGVHAFSEPECTVLTEITAKYKFDVFISLHSGIRQIYVPFADSLSKKEKRVPYNAEAQLELAQLMSQSTPNTFTYGIAHKLNDYVADGTIFDYMAGVRQIPFSFAIELWGEGDHKGARCFDLFNPKSEDLQKSLEEVHPIYETLFTFIIEWKEKQLKEYFSQIDEPPTGLSFAYAIVAFIILVTIFLSVQHKLPYYLRLYHRRRVVSLRSLSSTFSVMKIT